MQTRRLVKVSKKWTLQGAQNGLERSDEVDDEATTSGHCGSAPSAICERWFTVKSSFRNFYGDAVDCNTKKEAICLKNLQQLILTGGLVGPKGISPMIEIPPGDADYVPVAVDSLESRVGTVLFFVNYKNHTLCE